MVAKAVELFGSRCRARTPRPSAAHHHHHHLPGRNLFTPPLACARHRAGKLDILVNCAGIVGPTGKKVADVTADEFGRTIAVNLTGSFNVTKSALPAMTANDYGRILLIASIAGKEGNAGMVRRRPGADPGP